MFLTCTWALISNVCRVHGFTNSHAKAIQGFVSYTLKFKQLEFMTLLPKLSTFLRICYGTPFVSKLVYIFFCCKPDYPQLNSLTSILSYICKILNLEREEEIEFSFTSSIPKCLCWPGLGMARARAGNAIHFSHADGQEPNTWAVICCIGKFGARARNLNYTPKWDAGVFIAWINSSAPTILTYYLHFYASEAQVGSSGFHVPGIIMQKSWY